ncbi:hypothetical protein V475_07235 [Sphingobium baderi LL03]|uniref:Uncharacterized protein n=1 Tax=Sphingobium baderi LL03 TaxID=1114964 RepID=T0I0H2_9SPHN|nr:hypothetical protein L485_06865 [Sphingobium baderi LL03]KMS62673.1 hypothetical protein V475_07235 [Sphingobium baderi LL03]
MSALTLLFAGLRILATFIAHLTLLVFLLLLAAALLIAPLLLLFVLIVLIGHVTLLAPACGAER